MSSLCLGICALGFASDAWGQTYTVSGRVTDASTGEYVLGANVLEDSSGRGVSTNIYGVLQFDPARGAHILDVHFHWVRSSEKNIHGAGQCGVER